MLSSYMLNNTNYKTFFILKCYFDFYLQLYAGSPFHYITVHRDYDPYTGRLSECMLHITWLVQWKRDKFLVSILSMCIHTAAQLTSPWQTNHIQNPHRIWWIPEMIPVITHAFHTRPVKCSHSFVEVTV
jgi:hypothetical protein